MLLFLHISLYSLYTSGSDTNDTWDMRRTVPADDVGHVWKRPVGRDDGTIRLLATEDLLVTLRPSYVLPPALRDEIWAERKIEGDDAIS